MNAIDTDVLLYRFDQYEAVKQGQAKRLIRRLAKADVPTVLPWQVVAEFAQQLRRWQFEKRINPAAVKRYLNAVRSIFPILMPKPEVLDRAVDLTDLAGLSHWDAMIVAACIEAGITTLYTEDMGAPRQIEALQLVNPFQQSSSA